MDSLKLYMAIVYLRRLRKTGLLGENKEEAKEYGTVGDFTKLFGTEVRDE